MAFLDNDGVTRLTGDYLDIFARKEDAVLDPSGGLVRTDDGIKVDSLVQESDGEVSGAIAELTAKGHAEQFSTTGKNLVPDNFEFHYASNTSKNGMSDYTWSKPEQEGGGAGSIKAEGSITEIGSTYVLSFDAKAASAVTLHSEFNGGNGGDVRIGTDWARYQILVKRNSSYNILYIWPTTNNVIVNVKNIQLETGSTATAYEPYTGGAPSPSPDYPQEIQVVRGRNLLPNTATSQTSNGVTFTVHTDGSITVNGTATSNIYWSIYIGHLNEGTYYLSDGVQNRPNQTTLIYVNARDNSGVAKYSICSSANKPQLVVSADTYDLDSFSFGIQIVKDTTVSNVTFYPQLELGTTPHPYVPYGHVGMDVQGKNLLLWSNPSSENAEKIGVGISNSLAYVVEDGHSCYKISGPATAGMQYASADRNIVQLKADTQYTYSALVKLTTTGSNTSTPLDFTSLGHFTVKNEESTKTDKTHEDVASARIYSPNRITIGEWTRIQITFTTNSLDGSYFGVYPKYSLGDSFTLFICDQQLELGSEPTKYEPCCNTTIPIPLPSRGWVAGLPDGTADVLTLDGAGKVEWELLCHEVTYDGSSDENFQIGGNADIPRRAETILPVLARVGSNNRATPALCTRFNVDTALYTYSAHTTPAFSIQDTGKWIHFSDGTESMTVNAFKTWLSTHPITVLYPIATPVTEDCGYVDMPAIPGNATVTIPELDALGIKYLVDDSSNALAKQLYKRIDAETDEKIAANNDIVESNIAMIESSTAKSNHAVGSYFMLDNVLHKATSAIASGETITSGSNATPITLEQVISALNSSIVSLQDSVTLHSTSDFFTPINCTVGNEHDLYKYGKCVMIKLTIAMTASMSGTTRIGTIKSQYAPAIQAFVFSTTNNISGFVNHGGDAYIRDETGATHDSGYAVDMWLMYITT